MSFQRSTRRQRRINSKFIGNPNLSFIEHDNNDDSFFEEDLPDQEVEAAAEESSPDLIESSIVMEKEPVISEVYGRLSRSRGKPKVAPQTVPAPTFTGQDTAGGADAKSTTSIFE